MDKNFSDIINIFKRLDEGSMAAAEKHSTGPEFTGYWSGTDKATPGNKMVGGASESVETEGYHTNTIGAMANAQYEPKVGDKIRTRKGGQVPGTVERIEGDRVYFRHPEGKLYRTYISNVQKSMEETVIGPQGMSTQADPAKKALNTQIGQQVTQKLQAQNLLPPGTDKNSVMKAVADPSAIPGGDIGKASPQIKKVLSTLGAQVAAAAGQAGKPASQGGNPADLQKMLGTMHQELTKAS